MTCVPCLAVVPYFLPCTCLPARPSFSYASADWRCQMPDQPLPPVEEINQNLDFLARAITKAEFETVWEEAQAQRC
jgi:hypothetical protein